MTPKISVLIPTYNRLQWLGQAIDSVLEPGLDCELVVLDNGCTDGTWDWLQARAARDERIRPVRREINNAGEAYPSLLEMARGEYVNFFADDDEMLPGGLARKAALLDQRPDVAVVFSCVRHMNQEGVDQGELEWARISDRDIILGPDPFRSLVLRNYVPMPAAMFRRALQPTGEMLRKHEEWGATADWQFWLTLARKGAFAYQRQPTVRLRLHASQATQTHGIDAGLWVPNTFNVWRYWMLEADPPFVPSGRDWGTMTSHFAGVVFTTRKGDMRAVQDGYRRLSALQQEQEARLSLASGGAGREAFLFEPDWRGSAWQGVLQAYLEAFQPGDPVVLVLAWDPQAEGAPPSDEVRGAILELIRATGREAFPDLALIEDPAELPGLIRNYDHIQWLPDSPAAWSSLVGQHAAALNQAMAAQAGRGGL